MTIKLPRALSIFAIIALLATIGCGGKYDDVVNANNKYIDAMESFIDDVNKADSASSIAAAIYSYSDKVEKLAPKVKEMTEKYPELKDESNLPEEIKTVMSRGKEVGEKYSGAMMKTIQYMNDPAVQKAHDRFQMALEAISK